VDPSKKKKPAQIKRKPVAFKCTSDGKTWAIFAKKTCRYCLPIFEQNELDRLSKLVKPI
jgi:hypothetical protein